MTRLSALVLPALVAALAGSVHGSAAAQVPVAAITDQAPLLASADPKLAANKRLVYDFWREVFEAGHLDLADKYLAETYIQHNPNVPTGRAAFIAFFGRFVKPQAIQPRITGPLVNIVAERDMVVLSFVSEKPDPKDPSTKVASTWFDMFRIENGRIAEHWDCATKQ
jgi:predicted SnoaL-like aldol condensation-catalyzing enzyme